MTNITDIFGSMVFDMTAMKERLPKDTYEKLRTTITEGKPLSGNVAEIVANAVKEWAIEKGATHYTHWFQPMTGITAEKHDSFISPSRDGKIIMEFSGKELIQGEPDASSFPSGGIRTTFEARGYTAWDPTSFAFIKDGVLCIPTAFCSYGGQALDKKTPLLRSMEALNKQAMRVLKLFGNRDVSSIRINVGSEQEYFLVSKEMYDKRKDLIFTGRTLFGARSPKGQELEDHYFGAIKPKVSCFMKELNEELWKLGIFAKTEHNEAAPAQHELAPVFTTVNIAADHNQLTMELMQKIAKRHGLVCLLHEKPFAGVAGSGKHNNWSISTDTGINLLAPGATPYDNAQFLIFFAAVVQAVDDYQDLLRISVAYAGNDHRLGMTEAPPAILSIFVGDELMELFSAIEHDEKYGGATNSLMEVGVKALPRFRRDTTDRNRTSPFAFTGNKFEFRMLGASASISDCNVAINTAVAESLRQYADILEKAENFDETLHKIIKDVLIKHKRIMFNGNGYDDAWKEEASRRGLLNLPSTPDAMKHMLDEKNIRLFTKHKVLSKVEMEMRHEIYLENYCKILNVEALTMEDMVREEILPAISAYTHELARSALDKKAAIPTIDVRYETSTAEELSTLSGKIYEGVGDLHEALEKAKTIEGYAALADYYKNTIIEIMNALRRHVDAAELIMPVSAWPYPNYGDLLFGVR